MDISFNIALDAKSTSVIVTNTTSETIVLETGANLILSMLGTINGSIAAYTLSPAEKTAFLAKTPITIPVSELTDGNATILPDDFNRVQIIEMVGSVQHQQSLISTLTSYSYVQNSIHGRIVRTDRIITDVEKSNLSNMMIQLRALEILGPNPPVSLENSVVAKIKYLKSV